MSKKSPPRVSGNPPGWYTNTYLVAYSIHVVNLDRYTKEDGTTVERPIEIDLEDLNGLKVIPFLRGDHGVWIVQAPARFRSAKKLRDRFREILDPGDELLIVPINRPNKITGIEVEDALDLLHGMYG